MAYFVYIMTNKPRGVLYTGVTSRLAERVSAHMAGVGGAFTARYRTNKLVYFEAFDDPNEAILREKRLKRWKRGWKIRLIESSNPDWSELSAF